MGSSLLGRTSTTKYAADISGDAPLLAPAYKELKDLQAEVDADFEWLGEFAIDNNEENYVIRTHIPAVEALKAAIDSLVDTVDPQLLEGGVRRGGRYERDGNCELDEHFCDKTDV